MPKNKTRGRDVRNVCSLICFAFKKYPIVEKMIVHIPVMTDNMPMICTTAFDKGRVDDLICKFIIKNPIPIIAIAVRIHAKNVRSLAKCC